MIVEQSTLLEPLELARLYKILRTPPPCVTILLPPYHPGETAKSAASLLKGNIQDAARTLSGQGLTKAAVADLLEPLDRLAGDPSSFAGSRWGRAIFCSPEVFCQFQLMQSPKPSMTIAGCFSIRRLLSELWTPKLFYLLALSKESVRLYRCNGEGAESVSLPEGVPATLEEALAFDPPDHDLENRSAAGPSTGAMHAVRFGTGSGRETQGAHLSDYYKLVDRGMHKLLHEPGIPLVLAGVEEDLVVYRSVSTHRNLARTSLRGGAILSVPAVEQVFELSSRLRAEELAYEMEALKGAQAHAVPSRFLTDPDAVVTAAFEGRVHQLYIDQRAELIGSYRTWFNEEILNLAAVETLVNGGKAFELPEDMMPAGAAVVAVLRY
jgi:hypothetical protein